MPLCLRRLNGVNGCVFWRIWGLLICPDESRQRSRMECKRMNQSWTSLPSQRRVSQVLVKKYVVYLFIAFRVKS